MTCTSPVFVIAECGSCWRFGSDERENARRMIRAAKDAGADCVKFQWASSYKLVMARRGAPLTEEWAYKFIEWPKEWMQEFKAFADECGIEWLCTVFLPQDVAVIAPLVKRFKVAAKEWDYHALHDAIEKFSLKKPYRDCYISFNSNKDSFNTAMRGVWKRLYCVSKYPAPLEDLKLSSEMRVHEPDWEGCTDHEMDGLSDHTGHVLTGAVAVGAGARCLEVHFMLDDTPSDNPDACGHSHTPDGLRQYIANVRTASRMM